MSSFRRGFGVGAIQKKNNLQVTKIFAIFKFNFIDLGKISNKR